MTQITAIKQYDTTELNGTCDGELTPQSLLWLLQDAPMHQSEQLGLGGEYLTNNGLGWMLAKYDIEMTQYPKKGESVGVMTRPVGTMFHFVFREYVIYDGEGERIGHANSCWVLMDLAQRKPTHMPPAMLERYGMNGEDNKTLSFPLMPRPKSFDIEKSFCAQQSDIDRNGHVNNIVYLSWALDTLPDHITSRHLSRIEITFMQEVFLNTQIRSLAALEETDAGIVCRHELLGDDGDTVCRLRTTWR